MKRMILNHIHHYNHNKYWKRREYVVNPVNKNKIKKFLYVLYIKRCDAYNNCSFGTQINYGAQFKEKPLLPHGPSGIFVNEYSKIGINARIFHQVTIGTSGGEKFAPIIGDDCEIFAGAKIFGKITIGNNVKIGANAVVNKSFPSNVMIAGVPAKIIKVYDTKSKQWIRVNNKKEL